jgi:hypothetical protein
VSRPAFVNLRGRAVPRWWPVEAEGQRLIIELLKKGANEDIEQISYSLWRIQGGTDTGYAALRKPFRCATGDENITCLPDPAQRFIIEQQAAS